MLHLIFTLSFHIVFVFFFTVMGPVVCLEPSPYYLIKTIVVCSWKPDNDFLQKSTSFCEDGQLVCYHQGLPLLDTWFCKLMQT